MEKQQLESATKTLVEQDFALEALGGSYEDFEATLAAKVADMMAYELEALFNILYKMDVTEDKIVAALNPDNPELPHIALAQIIIKREEQRIKTRLEYPQEGEPFFG